MTRQTCVLGVVAAAVLCVSGAALAEPALRVGGAQDGALAAHSDGLTFERTFEIIADAEAAKDVTVTFSPFADAGGTQVAVENPQRKFPEVTVDNPASVPVRVRFPRAGKYTTEIGILVAGKREVTRLEVDAVVPPLALEVTGTVAARGVTGDRRTLRLALRETAGRTWQLRAPAIAAAVIKEGDRPYQVAAEVVAVRRDNAPVTFPAAVAPGSTLTLTVEIGGLAESGEYEGTLRLTADEAAPLDVPFTLTLKEPQSTAGWWIGAGVLLSALLKLWYGRWRKNLEARRVLAQLDEQIAALAPEAQSGEGRALIRTLRGHVAEARTQLGAGGTGDVAAEVLRLTAKRTLLEQWLAADQMVANLPDGDARTELRKKLDSVAATIASRAADDAAITAATTTLAELNLRESWRAAVAAELTKTRATVDAARASASPEVAATIAATVVPALTTAEQLLAGDELEKLSGPKGAIANVQLLLARALASGLTARLASKPAWIDDTPWAALKRDVEQRVKDVASAADGASALKAYDAALYAYLSAASRSLEKAATDKATEIDAKFPDVAADLRTFATSLTTARNAASSTFTADLAHAYEAAVELWPSFVLRAAGQSPSGFRDVDAGRRAGSLTSLRALRPVTAPQAPAPSVKSVQAGLLAGGFLAFVALLVIAIASGLVVLWTDDATWGGAKDHLYAFLWGLGLHQVGGGPAFEGLLGLMDKFKPQASG